MNKGHNNALVACDGDIEEGLHDGEGVKHDEHGLAISRSMEEVNEPKSWVEEVDEIFEEPFLNSFEEVEIPKIWLDEKYAFCYNILFFLSIPIWFPILCILAFLFAFIPSIAGFADALRSATAHRSVWVAGVTHAV